MVAADEEPALSDLEIRRLFDDAARPDAAGNTRQNVATAPTWSPSTLYRVDDIVTADPAAGRWWRCVVPGTSDATQPDWPDRAGLRPYLVEVHEQEVVWIDAGSSWTPTYDLAAAAARGWELKAGKAATMYDFTTDGQTFRRAQVIAHCRRMVRDYRRQVGSLSC